MTPQTDIAWLRELLADYEAERDLIADGQHHRVNLWPMTLGAAQATLSGAAIEALPALLDLAEAAAELRARGRAAATWQPQWTGAADVLARLDAALARLGETP